MRIGQAMLPELNQELAATRRVLERVPFEYASWKPHDKSMAMANLAGHVGDDPAWLARIIRSEGSDFETLVLPPAPGSLDDLLARFDEGTLQAHEALADAGDAHLLQGWSMRRGGKALLTMPRLHWIRGMTLNHMIHHRGQLTLYLRMCGVTPPALYPTFCWREGF